MYRTEPAGNKLQKQCTNPDGTTYWNTTAILVVWDDWGYWYDHVLPWRCSAGPNGTCLGYDNGTRQGQGGEYVYGFRVPLLVVSPFAKPHYISGTKSAPIRYDFGSILRFIEETFLPPLTFINPPYPLKVQLSVPGVSSNTLPPS